MNNISKELSVKTDKPLAPLSDTSGRVPCASQGGCPEGAEGELLGIYAELRTPPLQVVDFNTGEVAKQGKLSEKEAIVEARRLRYKLQDAARWALYGFHPGEVPVDEKGREKHHRTCSCTRSVVSPTVQLVKSSEHRKTFFAGVSTCANARTCPVCAATINERKANEMRVAANMAESLGYEFNLLTFTVPHTASDKIDYLVSGISQALSGFWRGAPAARFKKKYGIVGNIRSFEVRYGSNGWHPHFHIIIVSKRDSMALPETQRSKFFHKPLPPKYQSKDYNWILDRWKTMCRVAGLDCPNDYGLDIRNGSEAGTYITKFGSDGEILKTKDGKNITWDVMDEVTKGNTKSGKTGSLSPWDLLALSVDSDSKEEQLRAKRLFVDYARAMVGVTQIKWSRGLRDHFDLGKEKSDEALLNEEISKCDLLCHITPVEWKLIITNGMRPIVQELAENGDFQAVATFLFGISSKTDFKRFVRDLANRNHKYNSSYDQDTSRIITTVSSTGISAKLKD